MVYEIYLFVRLQSYTEHFQRVQVHTAEHLYTICFINYHPISLHEKCTAADIFRKITNNTIYYLDYNKKKNINIIGNNEVSKL